MITKSISERIRTIVAQVFNIPGESISSQSSSDDIENWDSLGHLNLMLALEQEFKIRLSPEQIQEMVSLNAIIKILEQSNGGNDASNA